MWWATYTERLRLEECSGGGEVEVGGVCFAEDLAELRRIPWRYLVVDEAHRLKNKDSALATDLRTLQVNKQ